MRDLITAVIEETLFSSRLFKGFRGFYDLGCFHHFWPSTQYFLQINRQKWLNDDGLKIIFAYQNYYQIQSDHTEHPIEPSHQLFKMLIV